VKDAWAHVTSVGPIQRYTAERERFTTEARRHREDINQEREWRGIFVRDPPATLCVALRAGYPSQKSRAGFLEPYFEKEEEFLATPPSQSIPSRNRGVYFGHVYPRERNKRHICIFFSVSPCLRGKSSTFFVLAHRKPLRRSYAPKTHLKT